MFRTVEIVLIVACFRDRCCLFFSDPLILSSMKTSNYIHASDNNRDTLRATSISKETSKSIMKELPSSKRGLLAEVTSLDLFANDPNLDQPRAKLISYIHNSMSINRGFNHVSLLLVGSTGVGKSSTVNHLLNIGADEQTQFAKTNSEQSETRITSEFLALADDPDLEVKDLVLGIVDTPGFSDTDGLRQDACNFHSIKEFYDSHPKVKGCLPNLILVVVQATDTRIAGENSKLSKSLRCLKKLSLVDDRRANVVAVLSFCCSVPCIKVDVWEKQIEDKKKVVQDVIFNSLKVNAPVVLLENDFESYGLEKDGDFTKLPNGELQPKNLYDACQNVLRKNEDNLGLITFNACFIKWNYIKNDGHQIAAKDAIKDSLNKKEEDLVDYLERKARGGA